MTSTSACCPLCGEMHSINHVALKCINPTMNGMHTGRHHVGLSFCVKALNKADMAHPLLGKEVPKSISRAIPALVFPNASGVGSSARYQSCPDAVFVRSIPGRSVHLDPTKIPPQDREIHLALNAAAFKFCPDTNPFPILVAATSQYASTLTRLKTRSSRYPNRNNRVSLQIIFVGVAATVNKNYTIKPLISSGLSRQNAKSLASKLCRHAIQKPTTTSSTRRALHFPGTSGGGFAERVAVESRRRRAWASRSMTDNPPDPH
eukprot:1150727-Pelagomonas_calceolata.AAC.1